MIARSTANPVLIWEKGSEKFLSRKILNSVPEPMIREVDEQEVE
jgi:hypothetical protein